VVEIDSKEIKGVVHIDLVNQQQLFSLSSLSLLSLIPSIPTQIQEYQLLI
jgi:hypothetical protein